MCLFGTAAGVPREEVLSVKCGGGVDERPGMAGALATAAAMPASGRGYRGALVVQLKARSVDEGDARGKESGRLAEHKSGRPDGGWLPKWVQSWRCAPRTCWSSAG